jgi:hypothetical protein
MYDTIQGDWDPTSAPVLADQTTAYDKMRRRCPVAYSERLQWSVFRHEDILRVLHDPETFSSVVSDHLSVPNGMDPPEHTRYRHAIEPFFAADRVAAFEPETEAIANDLARGLSRAGTVELVAQLARPFAARSQCAFLGWPQDMAQELANWVTDNQAATLAQDRTRLSALAREFQDHVRGVLKSRRAKRSPAQPDVTDELLATTVDGERMTDDALISVLRNWTVGEIGTITAAVGIIAHALSVNTALQERLRARPADIPRAVEEILRVHGPLATNRRVTTRPVRLGDRHLKAGEQVTLMWTSGNRDEGAFTDATSVDIDRDQSDNLLYGAGIHVCPGAPLARMELRIAVAALLRHTVWLEPDPDSPPELAIFPASGFSRVHLRVR